MVSLVSVVVVAVWAMLPAYVPNNAAVLAGGGSPIDGGRTWRGARVLGDGKTWRGTVAGVAVGVTLAVVQNFAAAPLTEVGMVTLPTFPVLAMVTLPVGAMLGDIAASFLKRRLGESRGSAVPGLDQLDFVVFALGLTALVVPGWFVDVFWYERLLFVVVVTPLLHLSTNYLAYKLDLKSVPW